MILVEQCADDPGPLFPTELWREGPAETSFNIDQTDHFVDSDRAVGMATGIKHRTHVRIGLIKPFTQKPGQIDIMIGDSDPEDMLFDTRFVGGENAPHPF